MKNTEIDVKVKEFAPMTVAYVRHVGPYKGNVELFGSLIARLMQWAAPRGILERPEMKLMAVYHDDPDVTAEENHRLSICCTVPEDTEVDGDIGKMEIQGGTCAVGHFELNPDEYLNNTVKSQMRNQPAPRSQDELQGRLRSRMKSNQGRPNLIRRLFEHPCVRYAAL